MILKKNISKAFYLFIFFHLFLWTLILSISNLNLPLDTIEALAWGSNLDLSLANTCLLVHSLLKLLILYLETMIGPIIF